MLLRSLVLTGVINGLFFTLLLKQKPKPTNSDLILMLWMGITALQLLFYYDNLAAFPWFPSWLQLIGFSLPLLNSPVLYFYISSLSVSDHFKRKTFTIHFLPFLIFVIFICFLYYSPNHYLSFRNALPYFSNKLDVKIVYILTSFLAIIPGFYAFASLFVLIRHQKQLPDTYSYTENINLNWLKWIVGSLLALFFSLFFLIKYGVSYRVITYKELFAVVGSILTLYVFFVGFGGLKQNSLPDKAVTEEIVKNEATGISYKNSGLSNEKAEQIFIRLKNHMSECKPYLNEELNLGTLSAQLGITSNQLSQVINQKSSSNFFNFINSYRVEEVKINLTDPSKSHYSILGIALECGFRSKSSFNKIFKEATGVTPLQYQKSIKN